MTSDVSTPPIPLDSIATAVSLVFGGCCTNAWSLERLLKDSPSVGSALTFCQLVFITLQSAPECLVLRPYPRLKPPIVPIRQWVSQVIILTSMSLLNNWAFAFHVPLTLQIVFRSAGLAVSMILNRIFLKKTYSRLQVLAVTVVSTGVLVATLSRPAPSPRAEATQTPDVDARQYFIGIAMLTIATILTSTLGILQERTYAKYGGATWREGVFYTHLLSLPVFWIFFDDVKRGLQALRLAEGPKVPVPFVNLPPIPPLFLVLALNVLSQSACVSGANLLNSNVSAVSTNLVLTARKALSLCISVWYFGQGLNMGLGLGALQVLVGTVLYSFATSRVKAEERQKKEPPTIEVNGSLPNGKTNGVHLEPKGANGSIPRRRRTEKKQAEEG